MTEPLDDLLRSNARVQDDDLRTDGVRDSMDAVWREARNEGEAPSTTLRRRSRRRARLTGAVAALIVVGVGVGGVPAFADWVSLRTGEHETGLKSEHNPETSDNELWWVNSPELPPYLKTWEKDYPLAPGYTLKPLIDSYASTANSQMTAASFHDSVFWFSECTWVDYWVTADRTGNTDAKREATQGLTDTVAKLDHPVPIDLDQPGRELLAQIVDAAQADDATLVERERRINCDWPFK